MNVRARSTAIVRAASGSGFLYGWLLVALFVEYARPTNQLTWLEFPHFYSVIPMSLLVVSMFASGLRPMNEVFADRLAKWVMLLFGMIILSIPLADVKQSAFETATSVLGSIFFFILISRLVTSESRLRGIAVTLLVAHLYLLAVNIEVITVGDRSYYLTGGTFLGDGNDYSLSLCILFPLVVEAALNARTFLSRNLLWSGIVVVILAITATQSRGGTLGLAGVLIYLWLRSSKKMVGLVGIVMVAAIVLVYSPPGYFDRMSSMTNMEVDGSAQGRIDAWKAAIGMVAHNPVLGIGAGNFARRWGLNAHSTYFLALAELGLFGFACVLMLVFGNMRAHARLRMQILARAGPHPDADSLRVARMLNLMIAAALGFAIAGGFLSATYYPHMFVLSGLMISGRIIAASAVKLHQNPPVIAKGAHGRVRLAAPKEGARRASKSL